MKQKILNLLIKEWNLRKVGFINVFFVEKRLFPKTEPNNKMKRKNQKNFKKIFQKRDFSRKQNLIIK